MNINEIEDEGTRELVENLMQMRRAAADKRKEADKLDDEANEVLLPLLVGLQTDSMVWDGMGRASVVRTTRANVDKDILKDALIQRGVSVDVVTGSFAQATKISTSTSVKFQKEKE